MKEQVYKDPRPPETFDRFHKTTRDAPPTLTYDVGRMVMSAIFVPLNRVTAINPERVPAEGPVILVPNHFSFIDHFYSGFWLRRKLQFMAKSQLFTRGPLTWVYRTGGVFPVRRGYNDEEAFKTSYTILERGGVILMYAEGGRSRTGKLGEPKRGAGRLALESGVTVVPVALYGSQHSRNFKRLRFPRVYVKYGNPIRFEKVEHPSNDMQLAASRTIFARVKAMFDELDAQHGRA